MCVIMLATKTRPTEEMVRRAWDTNQHGGGIAWRERTKIDGKDVIEVVWEKGVMNLERMVKLCATIPLPYVAHFRIASIGGVKPELTHPFGIGLDASVALRGRTQGTVLFHNGHWHNWNEKVLEAAIHSNNRLPDQQHWSDTRGMAYLVSIYGPSVMDLLPSQKGIILGPKTLDIYTGNNWEKIQDVWCSNDYFWHGRRSNTTSSSMMSSRTCRASTCHEKAQLGQDLCKKCEDKEAAAKSRNITPSVEQPSAVTIVTGGAERPGPLVKTLLMREVEDFYRAGHISKTLLKRFRKANGLSQERGNKAQRGLDQMRELSEEIAERLMQLAGSES